MTYDGVRLSAFLLVSQLIHCFPTQQTKPHFPYDLSTPDRVVVLDCPGLREISGLSPTTRPNVLSALSDEKGVIYWLDMSREGMVTDSLEFRPKGDFEGIELVDSTCYAIKSDGKIFEISLNEPHKPVRQVDTHLTKEADVEGLCWSATLKTLLLVTKGNPDFATDRHVLAYNTATHELQTKPLFSISPARVNEKLPYDGLEKPDFFSPSGIAEHPITGAIYVLSSALKRLAVYRPDGKLLWVGFLPKSVLPQPEGIAFAPDATLYLASEGKGGPGRVAIYAPKKNPTANN
jgi:uncharacterized protein YjiK